MMTCIGPPWFFTYRYKTCAIVESCLILTKKLSPAHGLSPVSPVRIRFILRCPENPDFHNFLKSKIFKFQWWSNSYTSDLAVLGSLIRGCEVTLIFQNSEFVKLSLTTSNLLYDKSVRKSRDKNCWKKKMKKS